MHYAYILTLQTITAVYLVIIVYSVEWSIVSREEAVKIIKGMR
jgi:hypothetical protein